MLRVNYAECHKQAHYAECHYAECHYAECCCAECRGAKANPATFAAAAILTKNTFQPSHLSFYSGTLLRAFPCQYQTKL